MLEQLEPPGIDPLDPHLVVQEDDPFLQAVGDPFHGVPFLFQVPQALVQLFALAVDGG